MKDTELERELAKEKKALESDNMAIEKERKLLKH